MLIWVVIVVCFDSGSIPVWFSHNCNLSDGRMNNNNKCISLIHLFFSRVCVCIYMLLVCLFVWWWGSVFTHWMGEKGRKEKERWEDIMLLIVAKWGLFRNIVVWKIPVWCKSSSIRWLLYGKGWCTQADEFIYMYVFIYLFMDEWMSKWVESDWGIFFSARSCPPPNFWPPHDE